MLAKPHMTTDLSRFCTSDQLSHPLRVDPTINFGKFKVTPFTYKHLFLKSKRTGIAPSFMGPTAIHYSKQKSEYKKIAQAVANSTHLADRGQSFITDGEEALYSALGEVMRHATGLRCFRHFQQNCRDKLKKTGIRKRNEQKHSTKNYVEFHNHSPQLTMTVPRRPEVITEVGPLWFFSLTCVGKPLKNHSKSSISRTCK